MNVNPCTPMARRRDPGTDGHTIMDSSATIWVPRPSIPTPYCPASTAGPKELTYYGGRIPALSPQPSEGHGGVRRVQQPPDVMATRNIPPLVKSHNQRSRSQKGQSRGAVREGNKSAQKNCRQNGNFASGEGDGPDSQRGRRREELQTAGGNSACQTALSVPTRRSPLDHSFGQSECSPVVPAGSKSSASQAVHIAHRPDPSFGKEHCSPKLRSLTPCPAPHPAHLKPQATSKGKCFTDAHIHEFIMKRLAQIMAAQNQSRGCEGAERTHCLSSSNLNVCLPSKQNTGSLHLKRDESAPRQFTSTASSEEVGLSSAGNAGSSALDCNGNEQLSTVFGKGIPKEHAELTRDVEKQDGHANPTPENDSTGTQDTALNNSHTVYLNECTEESPDFGSTKLLDRNVLCKTSSKPVSSNSCVDEMGYIGDADCCKTKLCQGTTANELSTVPILRYSFVALKELVSSINSISCQINSPAEDVVDVIVRCYWNGNKDDVNVFTSTEYPQIMKLAAAVCAKNEDENPVILSAVSGITSKEFLERRSASKVGTSGTREEYTSSWLNASSLDDLDKEPGGLHPISCVCHPETLETGTPISAENWQAEKTNKEMAEERTKMDTADSIQKSVLAVKGAPKSQKYEDISDDDIKNGKDMAMDLQSNRLPSKTTIENLSGTSSDCLVYEDISDIDISSDESLIPDKPLITQLFNKGKQPTESRGPINDPALAEHSFDSAPRSCGGTSDGDKTCWSAEKESRPNSGKNSRYSKGPGLISGSLPEMHAGRSPLQVIYISSDEDLGDPSTEEDGHSDTEMQQNGTEVISPKVSVESTAVSQRKTEVEDAEEDWLVIPLSIPNLKFVEVDGSRVSPAKTQSISKDIPPRPSTTKASLPTSCMNQLEVFDTLNSFLQANTTTDSQVIVVSDDELLVPKPTEGNLIPAEPTNGNIVRRCRKRSSSCDTEDSSDYSSSESSCNYLTVSPQCWENRNSCKSQKKRRMYEKLHSAKPPCTNTLSDGTVEEVQASLKTDVTMAPEPKSGPMKSEKDNENSVGFKKAPTKCPTKTNNTTVLKGLKRLTAVGAKFNNRSAKGLSSSDSEDSGDDFPVLRSGHLAEHHSYPVTGPQQMTSLDSEMDQKPPRVAEVGERVSNPNRGLPEPNPIIPRLIFRMPSDQSEPLTLTDELTIHKSQADHCRLSRETNETTPVSFANGHPRNKTRDEKLFSNKMLDGPNGEQKINALHTGHHVTSRKPTSVSKDHLITPKQLTSTAALQENSASTAPPRTASSSGTAPPRTASSSGTAPPRRASSSGTAPPRTASSSGTAPPRRASSSGTAPSRTASKSEHATPSPLETSPSSKYSSCLPTSPKKRISHYGRSTDKTNDSVHQNPSLLTQTPSRSSKGQSSSSKILKSSQFGRRKDAKEGTFSDSSRSAKVSARQQVRKDWKDSYVSTRIERRHSSGPEDARRHASTSSQNASVPEPHDAGNGAELEPCPNVAKQKSPASATPLMRRTMTQAKRLTRAAHPRGGPDERRRSVGEGYKWHQTQKNGNYPAESRRPRSSSPSEVELLSQW